MHEKARALYKRLIAFLKPQLREGSTVRAVILSIAPGSVLGGLITPDKLPAIMLVCGVLAAFIPDEIA